jgi:5'-methylthioadenosine nucleosidase
MISYSGRVTTQSGETVMVHLIWNGRCKIHSCNLVATTAAGVAAYAALQVFHPDLVISAGTAGGFSELGACIGDVYLSTKCIFHARRIPLCLPSKDEGCGFKVKHFEEYGFGHFRSPPLNHLAKTVGVKQGIVSSSDCLDCSEIDLQLLRSEGAVVKEMEAAAVAWVCQVLGTPFFALKSITDIVDGSIDSEEEFYSNLSLASVNLQEKLTLVVRHLGGTTLNGSNMSVPHVKQTSVKQHRALEDSSNVNLAIRDSFDTESGGFFRHTAYAFIAIGTCMSFYMTYYKSR